MSGRKFVIAGIGTDVGKTIAAAILCEALNADYWKPVQAGKLFNSDSDIISKLTEGKIKVHPEAYPMQFTMSPYASAKREGIEIDINKIVPPSTANTLFIELAGGIMVPLTKDIMMIDLLAKWNYPVILVSKNYVGNINHTLLTCIALKERNIPVAGIIFNGDINEDSETIIIQHSGAKLLGHIAEMKPVDAASIKKQAESFKNISL